MAKAKTSTMTAPDPALRSSAKNGKQATAVGQSKLATVVALLQRPQGAVIGDLMAATGWQAHSVRGAISGAIRKKRGLKVTTTKAEGATVYSIEAAP